MTNALTLIMPLESGVDLMKLSETLAGTQPQINAALTKIGTVHFARFVLFDASTPNLQPAPTGGPYKLAVITDYDGDLNTYIQAFVDQIGPVFDALLGFTADGQDLVPVAEHVTAFAAYIAANDASQHLPPGISPLFAAYPCTVQEVLAADPCPGSE